VEVGVEGVCGTEGWLSASMTSTVSHLPYIHILIYMHVYDYIDMYHAPRTIFI